MSDEVSKTVFKEYVLRKRREWIESARTPKDRLYKVLTFKVGEVLDRFAVAGGRRLDYYVFFKKAFRLIFRDVVGKGLEVKLEELNSGVDRVFDYVEATCLDKYRLNPEVVGKIEEVMVDELVKVFSEKEENPNKLCKEPKGLA
ncbi:MAG: hypothetical protein ACKD6O_08230 [Candidatus Bathyarchaeota archaeon]